MPTDDQRQSITRTPPQARQGERGPTVLIILIASTGLTIVAFAIIWLLSG